MRVLIVTPWFPSVDFPGDGIFNLRDAELLAEDHEVQVIHLYDDRRIVRAAPAATASGIRVTHVPFSTERVSTYRAARRAILRAAKDAQLIHTMAFPALLPVWLSRVGKKRQAAWVHTEHWSQLVSTRQSLYFKLGLRMLGRVFRKPDTAVAVSTALAHVFERHRKSATTVISNQVRLAEPGKYAEHPNARGQAALRLIGVGGLIARKGPIEAVQTIAALQKKGISATLSWAGVGPLSGAVREQAQRLGVDAQVQLLGHLSQDELSEALTAAHIFLLPTSEETFGVALAEALGHGLPVVTSGVGGHREFLPAQASRVASQRTGEALAAATLELLEDPERLPPEEIAGYARRLFSEDTRRKQYATVYRDALLVARPHEESGSP